MRALESSLLQAKAREAELVGRHETEIHDRDQTIARLEQKLHAAQEERNEAIACHEALRQEHQADRAAAVARVTAGESARAEATEQLAHAAAD